MRKAVHDRLPLFHPDLAWEQLPESVREQALEVLAALYLEITDTEPCGHPNVHSSSEQDSNQFDPRAPSQNGVRNP
jgi:hypothetical protein